MELRGTILLRSTADDTVHVLQTERLEQVGGWKHLDQPRFPAAVDGQGHCWGPLGVKCVCGRAAGSLVPPAVSHLSYRPAVR